MAYIEDLTQIINKALADEISSAMLYHKFSALASGANMTEFAEQLAENGDEEFDHFKALIEFASNHSIPVTLGLTDSIVQTVFTNNINKDDLAISALEKQAYSDYKAAALLARTKLDIETESFFIELMNDERKHLDSIVKLADVDIDAPLSFSDFVKGI